MTLFLRELGGFFRAPIAYAVGSLFLVVQGALFWALLELLADPTQPAPIASVLPTYMGGQPMFWLIALIVVAVACMRLFAEERRSGSWEMLMTTPVADWAVVVAKWAAALAFAVILWLPTLLYPAILSIFSLSGAALDGGALLASYAMLVLQLCAFTAIGAAVSASTRSQVVAAAGTVLALTALLLVGHLPELGGWQQDGLGWQLVAHISVRAHLLDAARGGIASASIVFYLSVTAGALFMSFVMIGHGRLRRDRQMLRWIAAVPVIVIVVSVNVLAARHSSVGDWSSARLSSVSTQTQAVLGRVSSPVDILIVEPSYDRFRPIYGRVELVLSRMQSAQPLLRSRHLDPLDAPGIVARNARDFGLETSDLARGGVIVLRSGERRALVDIVELASFSDGDLGVGQLSFDGAEAALTAAVARVSATSVPRVCFTQIHGESIAGASARTRFAELDRRLARDGLSAVRVGELSVASIENCAVVAVLAPRMPLAPREALAVAELVGAGRSLFLAARSDSGKGTGLELVLGELGIALGSGVVSDPGSEVGTPQMWGTRLGHDAEHPITRRFHDRRATVWRAPRPVLAVGDAEISVLVRSSEGRPIAAAVHHSGSRARAVLWGGGADSELAPPSANTELLVASLSWLAGRELVSGIGRPTVRQARLILSSRDRVWMFLVCVGGVPLSLILVGVGVAWRRRRV